MSYRMACTIRARQHRAMAHRALDAGDTARAIEHRDAAERLDPGAQNSVDARLLLAGVYAHPASGACVGQHTAGWDGCADKRYNGREEIR